MTRSPRHRLSRALTNLRRGTANNHHHHHASSRDEFLSFLRAVFVADLPAAEMPALEASSSPEMTTRHIMTTASLNH